MTKSTALNLIFVFLLISPMAQAYQGNMTPSAEGETYFFDGGTVILEKTNVPGELDLYVNGEYFGTIEEREVARQKLSEIARWAANNLKEKLVEWAKSMNKSETPRGERKWDSQPSVNSEDESERTYFIK